MLTCPLLLSYIGWHLPGIPTENEVRDNGGILLGELQIKQLEKIEQLFLYILALEERIHSAEKKLEMLQLQK